MIAASTMITLTSTDTSTFTVTVTVTDQSTAGQGAQSSTTCTSESVWGLGLIGYYPQKYELYRDSGTENGNYF